MILLQENDSNITCLLPFGDTFFRIHTNKPNVTMDNIFGTEKLCTKFKKAS